MAFCNICVPVAFQKNRIKKSFKFLYPLCIINAYTPSKNLEKNLTKSCSLYLKKAD